MKVAIAALIARYAADPVLFCADLLVPLREWQPGAAGLVAENRLVALKAARHVGKTFLAACLALWFVTTRPGSAVVVVGPTWQQASFFWTTLLGVWKASKLRAIFPEWEALNTFEFRTSVPGWRIVALSAEQGERIEGVHGATGVMLVFDEARGIPGPIFASLMQLTGGHEDAKVLAISTPGKPTGWFFDCFTKFAAKWRTLTVAASDLPRLRAHYDEQREELGADDPFFAQQLEGRFADVDEGDTIFSYESVRAASDRPLFLWDRWMKPWPGILGVDPAGRGKDHTIACYRKGPNIHEILDFGSGNDEMETVGKIVALAERLKVQRIAIDAAGMGSVFESRLSEIYDDSTRRKVEVQGFVASWGAEDSERYASAKAELAGRVRRRFLARGEEPSIAIPKDEILISQLCGYTWAIDSKGRMRLSDPNPSPDRADAFLISFAKARHSIAMRYDLNI